MSRHQIARPRRRTQTVVVGQLPEDLYDYIDSNGAEPSAPAERGRKRQSEQILKGWAVSDDWPERVPVTEAEIDLFEAWFGDIIDELFGKSA